MYLNKADFFTVIVTQFHESHNGSITLVLYELSFINTTILNARIMATTRYENIQLLPLSEGDMTICSPKLGNIARGQYNLSRVNKSSCHPHSRTTIVLLYQTTFEKNSDMPHDYTCNLTFRWI